MSVGRGDVSFAEVVLLVCSVILCVGKGVEYWWWGGGRGRGDRVMGVRYFSGGGFGGGAGQEGVWDLLLLMSCLIGEWDVRHSSYEAAIQQISQS